MRPTPAGLFLARCIDFDIFKLDLDGSPRAHTFYGLIDSQGKALLGDVHRFMLLLTFRTATSAALGVECRAGPAVCAAHQGDAPAHREAFQPL